MANTIKAFRAFIKQIPPRVLSGEVLSVLQYLEDDVLDEWETQFPTKEPSFLCSTTQAKEFVFRHEFDFGALWDLSELDEAAVDFAHLIEQFIAWKGSQSTNSNILKDLLNDFFNAFVEHVYFHSLTYVPVRDLKDFVLGDEYMEEKFDAIVDRNGPLLLQLMFQDRVGGTDTLRSVPMAESELNDLLRSFMADGNCDKEIEAIKKERRSVDSRDADITESEEVITQFQAFLEYVDFNGVINEGTFISFVSNVEPSDLDDLCQAITQRDPVALYNMYRAFMEWPAQGPSPKVVEALETALSDFHAFLNPDSFEELPKVNAKQPQSNESVTKIVATTTSTSKTWSSFSSYNYHEAELQRYRSGHSELTDANPPIFRNVDFYRGAIPHPEYHCFIDDFHHVGKYRENSAANTEKSLWFGNYEKLEREHSFIQHLFPIQEGSGLSYTSQRLQKHEIAVMSVDPAIRERIVRSLETMLDFFGFQLIRPSTIRRHPDYIDRFDNLDYSSHNYLRITRMLKCLGDLQFVELQHALVDRFILECFEWQDIPAAECDEVEDDGAQCLLPNLRGSLSTYWVGTVRSDDCRKAFEERINAGKKRLAAPVA